MCEVVELSDDEDSLVPEDDVGIKPKYEALDYDLPLQNMSSRHGVVNEMLSYYWRLSLHTLNDKGLDQNLHQLLKLSSKDVFAKAAIIAEVNEKPGTTSFFKGLPLDYWDIIPKDSTQEQVLQPNRRVLSPAQVPEKSSKACSRFYLFYL